MKKIIGIVLGAMTLTAPAHAQLVINELMQSNIDCIMDDSNEFPDSWVELYNPSNTQIYLNNYKIGLTADPASAYILPYQAIAAKGRVLIYCDKAGKGLHTDFRLESGKGGNLYLFKGNDIADKLENMKKQPAPNIAYGRTTDGSSSWGYMDTPTPNAANCGKTCSSILGEPVFSELGKVLETSQSLTLTLTLPEGSPAGTLIRYTTDGTEPTAQSTRYQNPIHISSTQIIRAKLFCDGYLSPRSTTASYIFHNRKMNLPVISIVSNNAYFYDNKLGIIVDGTYNSDGKTKNYQYDWRRPINFEYFTKAGAKSKLNQLCETRVMGGASRGNALKSLAVYANKRFGEKRLKYEFFPDQRPGSKDFKSIALRNAGNDFDYLYMRDALIQRSMAQHADLDWQAWSPAIIYINGVYKGILNIRERSNEDNIYTNYDGLEDIDMIENNWEQKTGDMDNFKKFKAFYTEHGHTMAEYEQWMDCQEYINLMAMNLFYNNLDFPGNNIVIWRPRTEGGKWRWISKDTDFSLNLYDVPANYKIFEWLNNADYDKDHAWANTWDATRLFRRLMEDADFKREFLDHTAIYLGDFLSEKDIRDLWDNMYKLIKDEYPIHRKLFNQWWPNYDEELTKARNWLHERIPNFYQQMADYYKLGTPTPMTIAESICLQEKDGGVDLTFNGVKLTHEYFNGKFFQGRKVTLEGSTKDGKEVESWDVTATTSQGKTTQHFSGSTCSFIMPTCNQLEVVANISRTSSIQQVDAASDNWTGQASPQRLQLRRLSAGTPVSVFTLQGNRIYQGKADTPTLDLSLRPGHYIVKVGGKAVKLMIKE